MAVLLVQKDFSSPSVEFKACIVYVCKPNLQSFVYISIESYGQQSDHSKGYEFNYISNEYTH